MAVHCLYSLGFRFDDPRVLAHSLVGCLLYGAFRAEPRMIGGLLAGLFLVPVVLLWLGHRLRRRTAGARAVFWGATIGHSIGIAVTLAAQAQANAPARAAA